MLHGNSSAFYVIFEEVFRVIYQYFLQLDISNIDLHTIVEDLKKKILEVKINTKLMKGKDDISPCSKVKGIESILLKRLEIRINQILAK